MESGNGGSSSEGVLIPVSDTSDVFKNSILTPLQSAHLYEESKQSFRYESAVLIKNPELEEKYNAFREKKREVGYSEEDLKETYGFLLFDDASKAHTLGETGVLSGNSTCTILGDPSKGVYISMYSDCLDLNRWYHGKSGCIAIIRLTKGRVKKVSENYTQNYTAPTGGFDCHVSEQLSSVSANTSSFLAFERTQYYMYELLDDGRDETAQCPSAACPFAIVLFSYTDTKATIIVPQEKRVEKKTICHYLPWRGQLQIGTQFYSVGLRSTAKALNTGTLPPVVKADRAISMLHLRQLLPRTVFETCFSGEVFLDGLYCSLCELVSSEVEETKSLSLLVQEVKEKDLALPVSLNDGGFLILLHSSHFLACDDTGSNAANILQGLFVFPETRLIPQDTKFGEGNAAMSSEILRVLPVLSYAEGEVEKTPIDPSDELCDVLVQHMQSYAALINPGLALSPSRDVSIFPDQYDVPFAHRHLYLSPEWTNKAWQSFRSYLSKPLSFQLPVSKVSQLLAAGQEERREDLDDDVYICLSSPEEVPTNHSDSISMEPEDEMAVQKSPVNRETSVDSCITSPEALIDLSAEPQNVQHDWQSSCATKGNKKSDLTVLIKKDTVTKKLLNIPPSDDIPAELIVSITSAKRTVTDESLDAISTVSAMKHNDFELSGFSATKLETAGVNSLNDENVKIVNGDCTDVTNLTKTKRWKLSRGHSKCKKNPSKTVTETPSLQSVKIPDNISKRQNDDLAKEPSGLSQMSNSSNVGWRKLRRRKRKFGKLSSKNKKVRSSSVGVVSEPRQQSLESTMSIEIEVCPMRKKTERWDLKPVVSECGRILVPHGSVDFADQIKSLKDKISKQSSNEQYPEEMLVVTAHDTTVIVDDISVNAHDNAEMEQEASTAPETVVDNTEANTALKDGVNSFPNVVHSDVNLKFSLLRQSHGDNGSLLLNPESSEHSSKNDSTDTPSSEAVNEKHTDNLSQGKCATKSEFLLSKLKSVLLRGKRKANVLASEEMTTHATQGTEPSVKKDKVDSDTEALKCNNAIATVKERVQEVSEMLSLDPLFAYALGLTPKKKPHKVQETEDQDAQLMKDSKVTQEQIMLDKRPQIIQRLPLIYPRKGRIKTLKKHQGIPAEYIKKKWWLHFQTPACFATDRLKNKECTRDNSVRKTVKEKMNSACSSTDALNLLADLALSASNGQVLQQPDPALERKPESFKTCDITKDVTSAEQESVLHTLLRQPAARPIEPLESTSPSHLAAGTDLVDLISKEHAYSLPPSSSLLLGLPGTPFQVSPISGSTRLLHHHQQFFGNEIQTLHPPVCQEDRGKQNQRTSECMKKHVAHRQKFRHSRTCVNKDGSVQVTRQWKENYDFNLDSKFTSDPKDRTIIRALHGPWDFSIQDTSEEVRLIVHMWIGLFYSRSTARFFHIDSNFTYPCSEENDPLEMFTGMTLAPAQSELKASPVAPFLSVTDPSDSSISKALDLSKKDTSVLDQGAVVLDLSLKNSKAESLSTTPQVRRKKPYVSSEKKEARETFNTLKTFMGLHEASAFQCYGEMVQSTDGISKRNDARNRGEISLYGSTKEKTDRKDETENSQSTEISLVQKRATDSSKSVTDKDMKSSKEAEEVDHTLEHDQIKSKDEANSEMKENLFKEGIIEPPKVTNSNDSTKKESSIVCNGRCLENEELLSREITKAFSPGQTENFDECRDYCTVKEGTKMIKQEENFAKERRIDEKDSCISSVEAGNDLSDDPVPMTCDSPDSIKESVTDCSHQTSFDEQPSQVDSEEGACHDLQLRELNGNSSALPDEHTILKNLQTLSEMEPVFCEPVWKENLERDSCLADEAGYQKVALPTSDENTCSLHGSCAAVSVPQTKDSVEPECQNLEMANIRFGLRSDQETNSVEGHEKDDVTVQKEQCHDLSHSPQYEAEEALTKEIGLKMDKRNEEFEKNHNGLVIPFIGLDISGENIVQPDVSQPEVKVEELVQGQSKIPFISETTYLELPTRECSTSTMYSEKTEVSEGKISLYDLSETNKPLVLGSDSDDRCPTPTMDEKPYEHISGPSISTYKHFTQKYLSRNSPPVKDEIPYKPNPCNTSIVNSKPKPHHGRHPDLELRTQRVLQSIDTFLSKSNHTDKSDQLETADTKDTTNSSSKPVIPTSLSPSHTSAAFKGKQVSNTKSKVVSASTSQELHANSSEHHLILPFKSKLEEVLGVRLQLTKTDSSVPQHYFEKNDQLQEMSLGQGYCHSHTPLSSECLQDTKPNIDQDRHKTSQSGLNHELRSYSQRPVMAVKPSKSDESQGDYMCKDGQIENSPKSKTKTAVVTCTTPTSMEKTESVKGNSEELNDQMHESSDLSFESSWLSSVSECKLSSDKAKFTHLDPSHHFLGNDTKFSQSPVSSQSTQSLESMKGSSRFVDGNQSYLMHSLVKKIGKTAKEKEECSDASASFVDYKNSSIIDDNLTLGPEASLICTVYNTSPQACSFLEQVSKRCLQDDLTQASMEQEHLIFSEQIKQLLKRNKRGKIYQEDTHDKLTSCTSPVTVHFSTLSEQDESLDYLDASSFVGQKIKVDMSDRKDLADAREERKTLHPQGTGNQMEHAGVSDVTEECARLYEAMMNDVCSVKKVPSRSKFFRMGRVNQMTQPHNNFDYCDQMKKEMDQSFHSNLNSVVKKSCKTKYRFYILMTSDDAFFEETKAELEGWGHTAVEPSEFFLHEDSSCLLIILRNEDIAEHICEVPHLLELKKSPAVEFAGIDEPDDVVNLTHQELFMQGGFIMFKRASLESLSLCNMKKCLEILQELSRTGKWKWILHYRDSRRLKEKARLSAEAKEKTHFLNWCQDTGILEVLPYHDCDLMSKDQPDYLTCLVHLQVQNVLARYPVFITDTTTDCAFGRNGILTMTVESFLTNSPKELFTV